MKFNKVAPIRRFNMLLVALITFSVLYQRKIEDVDTLLFLDYVMWSSAGLLIISLIYMKMANKG
jgi:hypothetical protein